ncbi:MAG: hypothetical protein AAF519_18345 [Bacteroidota bacterium]
MITLTAMYRKARSLLTSKKNIHLLTEKGIETAEIRLPVPQNFDCGKIRRIILLSPWCVSEAEVEVEIESEKTIRLKFSAIGKRGVENIVETVKEYTTPH